MCKQWTCEQFFEWKLLSECHGRVRASDWAWVRHTEPVLERNNINSHLWWVLLQKAMIVLQAWNAILECCFTCYLSPPPHLCERPPHSHSSTAVRGGNRSTRFAPIVYDAMPSNSKQLEREIFAKTPPLEQISQTYNTQTITVVGVVKATAAAAATAMESLSRQEMMHEMKMNALCVAFHNRP